jgi:chemotaxis protein MotA
MFSIIGILVVFGAVVGGYLMEKGHILVLMQPAELVIIAGAAMGTVLVANPTHILKEIAAGLGSVFGSEKYSRKRYAELLQMMFQVFNQVRRGGWPAVEADIEEPAKSKVFSAYPAVLGDHHVLNFVCDSLRTAALGAVDPFDLDQMMELDMDAHHHAAGQPVAALSTMADSLPGLGIVAAVLGVVITMGALGGPPEEIGHKVAAALVGTFLGILLCYGLVGPMAARMGKTAEEERACHHVLRVAITAFVKGTPPIVAVEMARRTIPPHVRPGFKETEDACRNKRSEPAAA